MSILNDNERGLMVFNKLGRHISRGSFVENKLLSQPKVENTNDNILEINLERSKKYTFVM